MERCTKCVLPETFPGIKFNSEGICNFCTSFEGVEHMEGKKQEYRQKFKALLGDYKGTGTYDALMCYSGGKDSSYTMAVLKEDYNLKILSLTFDNGFLPEQTLKNIDNVVSNVGVDHILLKPRFGILKKIFGECSKSSIYPPKTIERASTICTSCMGIVKYSALRLALEKNIPFIAFGWSPGQAPIKSSIMKNNPRMIKMMQKSIFDPLFKIAGDDIRPYFLEESHFTASYRFPYNISPLAFLDYNEDAIIEEIKKYGWEAPKDTDANSTNCLLNSFGNMVHKKQFGFHPYAFEMAKLVREGYVERDVALGKITSKEDKTTVAMVEKKLELE